MSHGGSPFSAITSDLTKTKYAPHPSEGLASAGRTIDNLPKKSGNFKAAAIKIKQQQLAAKKAAAKPKPGQFYKAPAKQRVMGPDTQMQSKVDDLFGVNW